MLLKKCWRRIRLNICSKWSPPKLTRLSNHLMSHQLLCCVNTTGTSKPSGRVFSREDSIFQYVTNIMMIHFHFTSHFRHLPSRCPLLQVGHTTRRAESAANTKIIPIYLLPALGSFTQCGPSRAPENAVLALSGTRSPATCLLRTVATTIDSVAPPSSGARRCCRRYGPPKLCRIQDTSACSAGR